MKSKENSGSSFIEKQFFGESEQPKPDNDSTDKDSDNASFIDEQYFGKDARSDVPISTVENDLYSGSYFQNVFKHKQEKSLSVNNASKASFIDEQYFGKDTRSDVPISIVERDSSGAYFQRDKEKFLTKEDTSKTMEVLPDGPSVPKPIPFDSLTKAPQKLQEEEMVTEKENPLLEGALAKGQISALDFARAYRKMAGFNQHMDPGNNFVARYWYAKPPFEKIKRPSDALDALEIEEIEEERAASLEENFVPVDVTPPWNKMTNWEVARFLKTQLIYQDEDLVAINKPYGIAIQTHDEQKQRSIDFVLPHLSRMLKLAQPLVPLHRLDAPTTGVLLFAKHEAAAKHVRHLFADRAIHKRYLAITLGSPMVKMDVINCPIQEVHYTKYNMTKYVLVKRTPVQSSDHSCISKPPREAVTRYKTIHSKHGVSLLVCDPITGIKHQLRVHLANGLRCPILGDHKYSSKHGLYPQHLPLQFLQHLRMQQSKSRLMMQHLHCLGLRLEARTGKREVIVSAQMPTFFTQTLRCVGIYLPVIYNRMRPLI